MQISSFIKYFVENTKTFDILLPCQSSISIYFELFIFIQVSRINWREKFLLFCLS